MGESARDARTTDADLALSRFRAGQSIEGRFQSFCRGRLRHLPTRLSLIIAALPFLLSIFSPWIAFGTVLVTFAGEVADCALLRRYGHQKALGPRLRKAIKLTSLTGAFQAMTICFLVAQFYLSGGNEARTLAGAICLAALLDSALMFGIHRAAAKLRLSVYGTGLALMLAHIWVLSGVSARSAKFDTAAVALLFCVGWAMVRHASRTRIRKNADRLATLKGARDLAYSAAELSQSRQQARRLAMVVERANDSVIITDTKGTITWVNRGFCNLTGYSQGDVIGSNVDVLNGTETDISAIDHLRQCRACSEPTRTEILNYRKDGSTVWVEVSMSPAFDDDGYLQYMVSVERDISNAKKREAALAEARSAAEHADRARRNFLATMSHEIRTPMNGIIGTADLLLETQLASSQLELVGTIVSSGEALLSIIDDILDFTKLEAGKLEVARQVFSPADCVESAVKLMTPLAEAKGLSVTIALPPDLPIGVLGDSGRLRQVILNLLGNAIKFTEMGRVSLAVRHQEMDGNCVLEVDIADTGIGIPPDKIDGVFDSFSQYDSTIAGRFGGTGLGLSISNLLVQAMGGEITVSSEPDKGSLFKVALNLPVSEPGLSPKELSETPLPKAFTKSDPCGQSVLIAEDNRTNTMLLDRILAQRGFDLIFAVNGREAVEFYALHEPDLVLMDMHMPILDGLAATREIRQFEAQIGRQARPIIALTANAFPEDRDKCLEAGMTSVLTKPFRKKELLDSLNAYLMDRAAIRERLS